MKGRILTALQWVFAALVVVFVAIQLSRRWSEIGPALASLQIDWPRLIGASLIVLAAYAVLIETWRRVLAAWDTRLSWPTAARIWLAASLGKYIPGNFWSLAALGVMARDRGASSVAAAGSSIIVNILNLVSGLALVLLFASQLVPHAWLFAAVAAMIVALALAAPLILPPVVRVACRLTRRDIPLPRVPATTVWLSLAGTALAWCAYGVAFKLFAQALLGVSAVHGSVVLFIAGYTVAYIVGFIAVFAPAGLGVREFGIIEGFTRLGLMDSGAATIVAIGSRLWLTVLEVLPGLVALAAGRTKTRTRPS